MGRNVSITPKVFNENTYQGVRAIMYRIGFKPSQPRFFRLIAYHGFPVYRIMHRKKLIWYADETMIQLWLIEQAKRSQQEAAFRLRTMKLRKPGGLMVDERLRQTRRKNENLGQLRPEERLGESFESDYSHIRDPLSADGVEMPQHTQVVDIIEENQA